MASETTKSKTAKQTETEEVLEKKPVILKDVDPNMAVPVRNGFQGRLIYVSPKTNEHFRWHSFGDEQELELKELKNAKSSAKKFFINNWFMFDDDYDWVIDYLGVRQYYKNTIKLDEFDKVFEKAPAEITKVISKLSDGQKASLSYRARQLIAEGKIDSIKAINAIEKALNIELIEK